MTTSLLCLGEELLSNDVTPLKKQLKQYNRNCSVVSASLPEGRAVSPFSQSLFELLRETEMSRRDWPYRGQRDREYDLLYPLN